MNRSLKVMELMSTFIITRSENKHNLSSPDCWLTPYPILKNYVELIKFTRPD